MVKQFLKYKLGNEKTYLLPKRWHVVDIRDITTTVTLWKTAIKKWTYISPVNVAVL